VVCDGIAQGHEGMSYSLVSREIMAAMVGIHAKAEAFDGLVCPSSENASLGYDVNLL